MRTRGHPPKKKLFAETERQEAERKSREARKKKEKKKEVLKRKKKVELRGSAHNPIELGSSPAAASSLPVRIKKQEPEVINLSFDEAADSSPVPSPTIKCIRPPLHLLPWLSLLLTLLNGHATFCLHPPPKSSQPPPDSPMTVSRAAQRAEKRQAMSASSTSSAEEISEALLRNVGSLPVKAASAKKMTKRKEVFIEISTAPPVKRPWKSTGARSSALSASGSVNMVDESWVKLAKGAPEYVAKMVQQGSRVVLEKDSERWKALGKAWMDLEVELGFKSGQLTTVDRPVCVGDWIQQARPVDWEPKPAVTVDGHRQELWDWWRAC
ncbi:hypothetical protein V5O48_010210 [Marasmius crinis-equi]|uniref:Uncharacterized protein n=1 Tax=Marasmius crinis-equi TaxID=585013 RepID=A0ABR3F933_9AGAR